MRHSNPEVEFLSELRGQSRFAVEIADDAREFECFPVRVSAAFGYGGGRVAMGRPDTKRRPRRSAPRSAHRIMIEARSLVIQELYRQVEHPEPEHHLLLAVIEQALHDAYIACLGRSQRGVIKDAEPWLYGKDCEAMLRALGIDPTYARRRFRVLSLLHHRLSRDDD